jgi:nicotinamide-nucleotide amidase
VVVREADIRSADDDGHLPDEAAALGERALRALARLRQRRWTVTRAESCTGGLLAALLTDQDGFGRCYDRGFVTYSDLAKSDLLGIERVDLEPYGAVSAEVARAMAQGAFDRSGSDLAVAITGFAGPAGLNDEAGLAHLARLPRGGRLILRECHFGALGRERVRKPTFQRALEMMEMAIEDAPR